MFQRIYSSNWLDYLSHSSSERTDENWTSLRLLNLYRVFLCLVLVATLIVVGTEDTVLGQRDAGLFTLSTLVYTAFSLLFIGFLHWKWPRFETQLYCQVYADIIAIILLMHASGGVSSGLGMLLVVTIAVSGLIIVDRFALLFAAIASLAVLAEQLYTQLTYHNAQTAYVQAGILGATLFVTALAAMVLARRNQETEAIALQRKADLENLAELNEEIIQQIESGLLFVSASWQIRVANGSARQLLNIPTSVPNPNLWMTSKPLATALKDWLESPSLEQEPVIDRKLGIEIQPHFLPMGEMGTLIRIEDNSELKQQLQQLKLASLGRLTASIAHEIRNPLGAISHAAQLLEESTSMDESDRRLTHIMIEQSKRMNAIIEDVLQLSRRHKVEPDQITLIEHLKKFAAHFCVQNKLEADSIRLTVPAELRVFIDPNHLHQVLWNLCSNSANHGGRESIVIDLAADFIGREANPYLEIRDNGKGIRPELHEEIFEPFYTSSHEGTGLGLYIARELCELNNARLDLQPSDSGTCFRITFNPLPV
ncbi:MAG: ATP-binding protein [Pseudomonadota bacterium]